MRERNDSQFTMYISENLHEKLREVSKRFRVPMTEIVRECITNDLPKLIDRENKRKNARKN